MIEGRRDWLTALRRIYGEHTEVMKEETVSGGCINQAKRLKLRTGQTVFVKMNAAPPPDMFAKEACGLRRLSNVEDGPRIPAVIAHSDNWLLLEYIETGLTASSFVDEFARTLANVHRIQQEHFGFEHDNYLGKTPQKNTPESSGVVFFRDHRLQFQQELARSRRLLPISVDRQLTKVLERLDDILEHEEKPKLIHGDLWSGNWFVDRDGVPCLVDPAVYFGYREADIAMIELFGGMPARFFDAYQEVFPLAFGYKHRQGVYDLYHMLNHLNLFGRGYLASVQRLIARYL